MQEGKGDVSGYWCGLDGHRWRGDTYLLSDGLLTAVDHLLQPFGKLQFWKRREGSNNGCETKGCALPENCFGEDGASVLEALRRHGSVHRALHLPSVGSSFLGPSPKPLGACKRTGIAAHDDVWGLGTSATHSPSVVLFSR